MADLDKTIALMGVGESVTLSGPILDAVRAVLVREQAVRPVLDAAEAWVDWRTRTGQPEGLEYYLWAIRNAVAAYRAAAGGSAEADEPERKQPPRYLASVCDTCGHTYNHHASAGVCEHVGRDAAGRDVLCPCVRFVDQAAAVPAVASAEADTPADSQMAVKEPSPQVEARVGRDNEPDIGRAIKYCCPMMRDQSTLDCGQHEHPLDCPDVLVLHGPQGPGLPVRDGGASWVAIRYCPWCATDLCAAVPAVASGDDTQPDRLPPAISPEGESVDHDCPFRRMVREAGELLGVKPGPDGLFDGTEIGDRIRALAEAGAPAAEAAPNRLALPQDVLEEALQRAWNDYVGDTGCVPPDFRLSGRGAAVVADFYGGVFARRVLGWLPTISAEAGAPAQHASLCCDEINPTTGYRCRRPPIHDAGLAKGDRFHVQIDKTGRTSAWTAEAGAPVQPVRGPLPDLDGIADAQDHGFVIARFLDATQHHGDRVAELWDDDVHRGQGEALDHYVENVDDEHGGWEVYELRRLPNPRAALAGAADTEEPEEVPWFRCGNRPAAHHVRTSDLHWGGTVLSTDCGSVVTADEIADARPGQLTCRVCEAAARRANRPSFVLPEHPDALDLDAALAGRTNEEKTDV